MKNAARTATANRSSFCALFGVGLGGAGGRIHGSGLERAAIAPLRQVKDLRVVVRDLRVVVRLAVGAGVDGGETQITSLIESAHLPMEDHPVADQEERAERHAGQPDRIDGFHLGGLRFGLAGLDHGGRGVRLPVERGLHSISDPSRQLIGPERHGGRTDANCLGCCRSGAAQEGDGFSFLHTPMLVHLQHEAQADLQAPLVKYAYMKTLAERTKEAIREGFSVGALAKAAGVSSAAVSLWKAGKTLALKAESAAGLQSLTGWSASWWATGKGERGETKAQADEPAVVLALRTLGEALAREMPADVRDDAAHLLSNLARRHGSARHQEELASLLQSVDVDIHKQGAALDPSQMQSVTPREDHTDPQVLGGDQPGGDEWAKRFKPSGGTGPLKGPGGTTNMTGKAKPTTGKGRKGK